MNLQKCPNNHYYDADKFVTCPHCGGGAGVQQSFGAPDDDRTVPVNGAGIGFVAVDTTVPLGGGSSFAAPVDATIPLTPAAGGFNSPVSTPDVTLPITPAAGGFNSPVNVQDNTLPLTHPNGFGDLLDDDKTVPFNVNKAIAKDVVPSVGWLVCVKGLHTGKDFRLVAGNNRIGRGEGMDIRLAGEETVSRENHATVVFEPRMNKFFALPGASRSLAYVNDSVLLTKVELKKNDKIEVGDAVLMLIPCCDDSFRW